MPARHRRSDEWVLQQYVDVAQQVASRRGDSARVLPSGPRGSISASGGAAIVRRFTGPSVTSLPLSLMTCTMQANRVSTNGNLVVSPISHCELMQCVSGAVVSLRLCAPTLAAADDVLTSPAHQTATARSSVVCRPPQSGCILAHSQ